MRSFPRKSLQSGATFEGRGLHCGAPVVVRVKPGEHGIVFHSGSERVEAKPENVSDTTRCTKLGPVSTIEHLMSALAGLGITDADIEVEGPEMPAMDGAAHAYVEGIMAAGLVSIGELQIEGPFARVYEKGDHHQISIATGEGLWRYEYNMGDRWPYSQVVEVMLSEESYTQEIASARTFALEEELPWIKQAGLGQGLDESTALVLGSAGYLNEPKFPDEPVRHKLLDLIGDLALAGVPVHCLSVSAERSGHTANVAAAAKLAAAVKITRI